LNTGDRSDSRLDASPLNDREGERGYEGGFAALVPPSPFSVLEEDIWEKWLSRSDTILRGA
jgi:hypothetical protein